ncbi:MAG: hypothetical protein Q7O66_01110 [Dehalococcoidia bacterium]|nr:hypothetical protein [Dehalococcoidia bacterium]
MPDPIATTLTALREANSKRTQGEWVLWAKTQVAALVNGHNYAIPQTSNDAAFIVLAANSMDEVLAHIDTLTGLVQDALDFDHAPGCSGGVYIQMEPDVDIRAYPYQCKPSCGKLAFDKTVRAILRQEAIDDNSK